MNHDIVQAHLSGFGSRGRDHLRIDVDPDYIPRYQSRRCEREQPVTAPELDDISARTRAVEFLNDSARIEEGIPHLLIRHPAFAPLRHLKSSFLIRGTASKLAGKRLRNGAVRGCSPQVRGLFFCE